MLLEVGKVFVYLDLFIIFLCEKENVCLLDILYIYLEYKMN